MNITHYVSLKFNSAKLFRAMQNEYTIAFSFKEPITKFQITNMLYALTNQKLVNTRRVSMFEHQEDFLSWSDECLLKIEAQPTLMFKEHERVSMSLMNLAKDKTNSTAKSRLQWRQIRHELMIRHGFKEEGYLEFLSFMEKTFGVTEKMNVDVFFTTVFKSSKWIQMFDILEKMLNPSRKLKFLGVVASYGLSSESLVTYDKKTRTFEGFGHSYFIKTISGFALNILGSDGNLLTTNINNNGIGGYERYDGEILIPIRTKPDEKGLDITETSDYQMILNGPGVATILDGGSVTIDSFKKKIDISRIHRYQKVKDISLEEVQYFDYSGK